MGACLKSECWASRTGLVVAHRLKDGVGDPMWQQGENPCVGEKPTALGWMTSGIAVCLRNILFQPTKPRKRRLLRTGVGDTIRPIGM